MHNLDLYSFKMYFFLLSEEDSVAHDLYKKVRVLCWVMTNPNNHQTKAKHVRATWGKRCNRLVFMSSAKDPSLPAIALKVGEGRDHLWGKTREAFKYVYEHYYDDADWFLKADDDTYVIVENLRYLLKDYDTTEPLYMGRRFKPYIQQGYMSGGAGYLLSKAALKKLVVQGLKDPSKCRQDHGGAEDLEMGSCMQRLNVKIVDTRDSMHRERFMPFVPEHHLIPKILSPNMWYWSYSYYPAKEVNHVFMYN